MEKLRLHLRENKIKHRDFAALIGCSPAVFSRIMSREVELTLQRAAAIEHATAGAVSLRDLVDEAPSIGADA